MLFALLFSRRCSYICTHVQRGEIKFFHLLQLNSHYPITPHCERRRRRRRSIVSYNNNNNNNASRLVVVVVIMYRAVDWSMIWILVLRRTAYAIPSLFLTLGFLGCCCCLPLRYRNHHHAVIINETSKENSNPTRNLDLMWFLWKQSSNKHLNWIIVTHLLF